MSRWPKPGDWYESYTNDAINNGVRPGCFVLMSSRNVWVTFSPEFDRPFGLLSGEYIVEPSLRR